MTNELTIIRDLIARLADAGVYAVCAGGAARDAYMGRKPKDYDIAIIDHKPGDAEALEMIIQDATGAAVVYNLREQGMGSNGTSNSDGDATARGLDNVFEVHECEGEYIVIQFLVFTASKMASFQLDIQTVVELHDCTLNQAWFEEVGGRLVPRVTAAFPTAANGLPNVFRDEHVNFDRKAYIAEKFPQFTHQ